MFILDKIAFKEEYQKIKQLVSEDFEKLDNYFESYFYNQNNEKNRNPIFPILSEFFSAKGKQIRSLLIFLITRAMNQSIEDFHYKLAFAIELIHNATLIHDDIIDCSLIRRGQKTLNFDYDSKLAVLSGDFLLCEVLRVINGFENENIRNLHVKVMSEMINGEISQYFNRFKVGTIENYIEKSKAKTARLFEAALLSCVFYGTSSQEEIKNISKFAIAFGTAFQIFNDLDNFDDSDKVNEDIENGDYSAPLIYFAQEKGKDILQPLINSKQVIKQLKNTAAIEKTQQLAYSYIDLAIENLLFLEDNQYRRALISLCNLYKM